MPILDEAVAEYIRGLVRHEDDLQRAVRAKARELGVPAISPEAGQALQLLCRTVGARHVLELGTCTGYSGIWLARGLPLDGHLETVEFDSRRAEMAREHFRQAGVADRVTVTVGDARDILAGRADESFDAVFIDADKEPYPHYFQEACRVVRPGGLILADNVLSHGRVAATDAADADTPSPTVRAVRRYNETAATDCRVLATILPVGDGLGVALKLRT